MHALPRQQGCQRYWTDGGMLRNVPVGSGRRKNKNSVAREAEKAATADSAKQQLIIAAGAYEQFRHLLMDPSLAFSVGAPLPAGATAGPPLAAGLASEPLPAAAAMGSYPPFPQAASGGLGMEYNNGAAVARLTAPDAARSGSPDAGGQQTSSDAVHTLLGGPSSAAPPATAGARGSGPSMESKPLLSLQPAVSAAAAASEPSATGQLPASQTAALSGHDTFGRLMGTNNGLLSHSAPNEWASMAAAGQMQVCFYIYVVGVRLDVLSAHSRPLLLRHTHDCPVTSPALRACPVRGPQL